MTKKHTMQFDKVNEQIVNWLKTYAENSKVNGFVIGISGGVDSAVTSHLCAQTGLKVLCVEMPIHQAESHVTRGREHIEQLKQKFPNVSSVEADLTATFETFKTAIPDSEDTEKLNLALNFDEIITVGSEFKNINTICKAYQSSLYIILQGFTVY